MRFGIMSACLPGSYQEVIEASADIGFDGGPALETSEVLEGDDPIGATKRSLRVPRASF
jgi:hypothetical protein